MKTFLLAMIMIICLCCTSKSDINIPIQKLPYDGKSLQKQIIGQLSGAYALDNGILLKDRWSGISKVLTRAYLKSLIAQLGLEAKEHQYSMPNMNFGIDLLLEPFKGTNVYTILPATKQSDEYIVLGAHYDTGGRNVPGAIDNATGMVLAYTVVRRLQKLDYRSKNIILVFFDQEEEELIGSSAFAKFLIEEKYKIHSVHTFDMVGWDSDHNKEVELEMPDSLLEKLYTKNAENMNIPVYTTQINSTDHYSFIKKGFNTIGVSQAYAKRDNSGKKDTPEDTFELVNFDYLYSTTMLVYTSIEELITLNTNYE